MNYDNQRTRRKLMNLLNHHKPGTVCVSSWLVSQGISYDLQKYYRKAGWLKSIGRGAYCRPNEKVTWEGAVYALQNQAKLDLHPGALVALAEFGFSHYLKLGRERVHLFSPLTVKLPSWFVNYDWGADIIHVNTEFLPQGLGVGKVSSAEFSGSDTNFSIDMSEPERAIIECLYLTPKHQDFEEVLLNFEMLVSLRPNVVQTILERCRSIKVKRLFLYFANRFDHQWLSYVDTSNIDLGSGDRSIVPGGIYDPKFRICIPREFA